MTDITWDFTDDTQTITVDGVHGTTTNITVGETVTLTVFLEPGGSSSGHLSAYQSFKDYEQYLNEKAVDFGTDYEGQPWYRYTLHPAATINSYLFKIQPGADVTSAYAFWGLLVGVEDQSRLVGAGEQLALEFAVLADTDEFSTRGGVQDSLRGDL